MRKLSKLFFLFMLLLAFGIVSCSSDDEPNIDTEKEDPIDIEDPNAVAESLTFKNGTVTKVDGAFPAPSEDAPDLYSNSDEDIVAIAGGSIAIPLNTSSDIKGVYVQVEGADSYYNLLLNNSSNNSRISNGRKKGSMKSQRSKEASSSFILLEIAGGLQAGDLCIKYAVYDNENRVSQAIETCIKVKSYGGSNSGFLTATQWELESETYISVEGGDTYEETIAVGEPYIDAYTYSCSGIEGIVIEDKYTVNSWYFTFLANGKVESETNETQETAVNTNNLCETGEVEYKTETIVEKDFGNWSYDDSKKELTLVTQYEYTEEDDYGNTYHEVGTDVSVYKLTQENGKITITEHYSYNGGSYSYTSIYVLKPRN